jgi:hypothetical protein
MEWTISLLSESQVLLVETKGQADESGSFQMSRVISKAMREHRVTRCLIDHSAISSFSGDAIKMYHRSKELHKSGTIPYQVKIAEVVHPNHRANFDFLETVFRNNGFDFSAFDDRESAIRWLTQKDSE